MFRIKNDRCSFLFYLIANILYFYFVNRWFGTYPEIWETFKIKTSNLDELLESPTISRHAKKFEELFEIVIYNLDKREKLVESLIEYGRFHHSIGAQQKFATVSNLADFT